MRSAAIATSALPPVDTAFSGTSVYVLSAASFAPMKPRKTALAVTAAPTSTSPCFSFASAMAASRRAVSAALSAASDARSGADASHPSFAHTTS